jgi:DNA-directed RNA polymerase specialized sigma24 family protein
VPAVRSIGRGVPREAGRPAHLFLLASASGGRSRRGGRRFRDEGRQRVLATLPEQDRELIVLRDYVGMTWDEVARRLGRPSADAARMAHGKVLVELGARLRGGRADP